MPHSCAMCLQSRSGGAGRFGQEAPRGMFQAEFRTSVFWAQRFPGKPFPVPAPVSGMSRIRVPRALRLFDPANELADVPVVPFRHCGMEGALRRPDSFCFSSDRLPRAGTRRLRGEKHPLQINWSELCLLCVALPAQASHGHGYSLREPAISS